MFPVGIQHPRKDGSVLAWIDLQDEAISTAGDYERFFERDGVRYHHILDPRTLQPARSCQSVTVIAREGIWADGLDTGIFVMGAELGMQLVEACRMWRPSLWIMKVMSMCPQGCGIGFASREGGLWDDR